MEVEAPIVESMWPEDREAIEEFQQMVKDYGVDSNGQYPGFFSDPLCLKDFSRENLEKFMPRVGTAFCIFLTGLYINNVSQAWLENNVSGYYENRWMARPGNPYNVTRNVTLWDVVFETLPLLESTKPADTVAGLVPLTMFIRFVILPGPLSLRWTVLCRVMLIWGTLWLFRAFTIWTTPLPNPDPTCVPRISFPHNVFLEAWANLPFVFWYNEMTCQDVMYSGHTVAITMPMLFLMNYHALSPWFQQGFMLISAQTCFSLTTVFRGMAYVFLAFSYYLIIGSHFHYTVDVLVGVILTSAVFHFYHNKIKVAALSPGNKWPIARLLTWMEADSKDLRSWLKKVMPHDTTSASLVGSTSQPDARTVGSPAKKDIRRTLARSLSVC